MYACNMYNVISCVKKSNKFRILVGHKYILQYFIETKTIQINTVKTLSNFESCQ